MSAEYNAHESAIALLLDAIESVRANREVENIGTANAILAAAHAIVAKLDAIETTHLEAMRDQLESLDCLGARFDVNAPALVPTSHESEVMYRALEEDYLLNHKAANIDEMDAALRRFKQLSGC